MFNLTLKALMIGGIIGVIAAVAVPMSVLANRDRGAGDPHVYATATPVLQPRETGPVVEEPDDPDAPAEAVEEFEGSEGERVFSTASPITCTTCHSLDGTVGLGPSLQGIAERAGTRIAGMAAEEYIRQSIIDTNAYIVDEFPESLMPVNFSETLTPEELEAVIAYLLEQ